MNRLNNFFQDFELEKILEHCNDDGLTITGNSDVYLLKSGDWLNWAKDKCDTLLTEYGYDTAVSNARLQKTMPLVEYPIHRDFSGKIVSLIIYLIGKDGTVFYENAEKKGKVFYGINPTVDTFTPNTGYWFDNQKNNHWHSYQNTQDTPRWIFMYNVVQKV